MHQEFIKVCSKCGEEYSPEAMVCVECGGRLVSEQEYERLQVPLTEEEERLVCVREDAFGYLRELERRLKADGVRSVIHLHGDSCAARSCQTRYGLYVIPGDESKAKEIIHAHWLKGAPENALSFDYQEQELSGICPACATAIPENSAECPECGLVVKAVDEVSLCPTCDAKVGDDVNECPNCGEQLKYQRRGQQKKSPAPAIAKQEICQTLVTLPRPRC